MRSLILTIFQTLWAVSLVSGQTCDICNGGTLPELNQPLAISAATVAECNSLATVGGPITPTFCDLLEFFDGFTCGAIQNNPALAFDLCPQFQIVFGGACSCLDPTTITTAPAPVAVPAPVVPAPAPVPPPAAGPLDSIFGIIAFVLGIFGAIFS